VHNGHRCPDKYTLRIIHWKLTRMRLQMNTVVKRVYSLVLLVWTTSGMASVDQAPFPFDISQLSGTWVDNYSPEEACISTNARFRYEFSSDRKRVTLSFNHKPDTPLPVGERIGANILSATAHTLVIKYDEETRMDSTSKPVEWELSVVAPGVYRWRATDRKVNTVVGIRCSAQ
jgi:hypothetical protein